MFKKTVLLSIALLVASGNCIAATRSINKKAEFTKSICPKSGIVVVDFYATWCGPCKKLAPVIEELSKDEELKNITFIKVDTDASDFSSEYGVQSLPTLVFFKDGKKVKTITGFKKKAELKKIIKGL